MKKVLYIFTITSLMLASCGGDATTEGNKEENNAGTEETTTNGNPNVSTEDIDNPKTAEDPYAQSATQPQIMFDNLEHHFGTITEGERVKHTYTFQNVGNADLLVTDATASCGCTIPSWTKDPIKPGEKGEITVEFNSTNKMGEIEKDVKVFTNANPAVTVLKFTTNVVKDGGNNSMNGNVN